ncbi:MAG TPA: universal stress protein [Nocardioidaceae bacterium]
MFESIVVPLDLEAGGDRALPIAGALARGAGVTLELITVSSPGMSEEFDLYDLSQRARSTGAASTTRVLHGNNVADTILSFVDDRPNPLVVMGTRARGPLGEYFLGSVSEAVLTSATDPVLLVGPRTDIDEPSPTPTLVIAVDGFAAATALAPAVTAWVESFGGPPPWMVEVAPDEGDEDAGDSSPGRRLGDLLDGRGITVEWEVSQDRRPVDALVDFADHVADAVLAVASSRWTDPRPRFTSTARKLTQQAHHPVLVVPVRDAGDGAP